MSRAILAFLTFGDKQLEQMYRFVIKGEEEFIGIPFASASCFEWIIYNINTHTTKTYGRDLILAAVPVLMDKNDLDEYIADAKRLIGRSMYGKIL